jgi:hypothetical protein
VAEYGSLLARSCTAGLDDQEKALRMVAERRGESLAALVREGVDLLLDKLPPEEDPLLDLIGLFDSGYGDLAEQHDQHLARLLEEESKRESSQAP